MKISRKFLQKLFSILQVVFIMSQVVVGTFGQTVSAEAGSLDLQLFEDGNTDGKELSTEIKHAKDQVEDKELSISFPEDTLQISQIKYFDPDLGQDVTIPVTSNLSTYKEQMASFENYINSLQTYQEDMLTYQDDVRLYRQKQQELLQIQEELNQLESNQAQADQVAESDPIDGNSLGADESETDQVEVSESEQASEAQPSQASETPVDSAAIEHLRGQISQLEESLVEPTEPVDPQDDAKDKL